MATFATQEDGLFMDLVCRALWLNQVLHLVQPHQVYDQVMYMTATSELVTPSSRHKRVSSHSELVTSEHRTKQSLIITGGLQPVATCRQSPYLHKPAIIIMASSHSVIIMTSFASLAAPVLIMTSFATELATPSVTDVRCGHLIAFNI